MWRLNNSRCGTYCLSAALLAARNRNSSARSARDIHAPRHISPALWPPLRFPALTTLSRRLFARSDNLPAVAFAQFSSTSSAEWWEGQISLTTFSLTLYCATAAQKVNYQDYQCYYQQQMDQTASDVKAEAEKPKNQQYDENRPKHVFSPLIL